MKSKFSKYWKLAIAAALALVMGQAIPALGENLVKNGSFEVGYPGDDTCGRWWYNVGETDRSLVCNPDKPNDWYAGIPEWTRTGQGVNWYKLGPYPYPFAADGSHAIDLIGSGAGIKQDVPTEPGVTYTLSFRYARNGACNNDGVKATVTAGGAILGEVTPSATGTLPTDWQPATYGFTATANPTTIAFVSSAGNTGGLCAGNEGYLVGIGGGVLIDLVSVDLGAVPPPPDSPPSIDAFALGDARVDQGYDYIFTAQGSPLITWSVVGGAFPPGMTLSSSGVLTGVPTTAGTYTFTIRASNDIAPADTEVVTLRVLAAIAPPVITTPSNLGSVQVGATYSRTLMATGTGPFTWSTDTATLPAGLSLTPEGLLSGTPTAAGTFTFTVRVSNPSVTATTKVMTLSVLPLPPVIDTISLGEVRVGVPYTYTFTAQSSQTVTWSLASGRLPAGLTLTPAGVLSGTPTTAGSFKFSIRASNGAATSPTAEVTGSVLPAYVAPAINPIGNLPNAVVGTAYSRTFTATGTQPITWNVSAGALPPGLSLSTGGLLSGTPTLAGTYTFTIRASSTAGEDTEALSLTVVPPQQASMPETIDDCKKDGWRRYGVFKNQGDCVSWVVTHGKNPPAGKSTPKTKDDCKGDDWRRYDEFRNRQECVNFVESLPKSKDECKGDGWRRHGCYRDRDDCEDDADRHGERRRRDK